MVKREINLEELARFLDNDSFQSREEKAYALARILNLDLGNKQLSEHTPQRPLFDLPSYLLKELEGIPPSEIFEKNADVIPYPTIRWEDLRTSNTTSNGVPHDLSLLSNYITNTQREVNKICHKYELGKIIAQKPIEIGFRDGIRNSETAKATKIVNSFADADCMYSDRKEQRKCLEHIEYNIATECSQGEKNIECAFSYNIFSGEKSWEFRFLTRIWCNNFSAKDKPIYDEFKAIFKRSLG